MVRWPAATLIDRTHRSWNGRSAVELQQSNAVKWQSHRSQILVVTTALVMLLIITDSNCWHLQFESVKLNYWSHRLDVMSRQWRGRPWTVDFQSTQSCVYFSSSVVNSRVFMSAYTVQVVRSIFTSSSHFCMLNKFSKPRHLLTVWPRSP